MLILPQNYQGKLNYRETEKAIKFIKTNIEKKLCNSLNLERVSAPLFVTSKEGINDDLNGVERAVSFDMLNNKGIEAQIVHSLAKWKRLSLKHYGFKYDEGLYTNMNAIRRDEEMDNIHSVYVDQWDWEKVINQEDRTITYLKITVNKIVNLIIETLNELKQQYNEIKLELSKNITYITAQELEDLYPELTPKQREMEFVKKHKTVFIMQIGDKLKSGEKHDGRAPDYDDWSLNGDIVFWNELLQIPFEVSSMGIRVDKQSLEEQLIKSNCEDRKTLKFHSMLLNNELPLSIGGGIGQSRICMLLLEKAHIGEVHVSIWPKEMQEICENNNIDLL
jgi:aspartate--ammonia ligase